MGFMRIQLFTSVQYNDSLYKFQILVDFCRTSLHIMKVQNDTGKRALPMGIFTDPISSMIMKGRRCNCDNPAGFCIKMADPSHGQILLIVSLLINKELGHLLEPLNLF